jgi:hypothetical protein
MAGSIGLCRCFGRPFHSGWFDRAYEAVSWTGNSESLGQVAEEGVENVLQERVGRESEDCRWRPFEKMILGKRLESLASIEETDRVCDMIARRVFHLR